MRFRIEMWNDKVENEVKKHLIEIVRHEIQSDKVRVIPFEKVLLTSNSPTEDYSISPLWKNYDKSQTLWFSLSCFEKNICDELASEMRSDPKHLDHLKLLYSFSTQTWQTQQVNISFDSVTSSQMVTNLLRKFRDREEVFLTANDEKEMLAEMATNIRMDTFDDFDVGSPDTEFQISNILKDLLVESRTAIKEHSKKMWDSVFWNEENYRPDKTTKTLNEIINKLDKETQKKLADLFQKAEKQSEIIEKLTSGNKEKRQEEQLRCENQPKDADLNEMRRSQSTDQEQSSRNQIEKWELAKNHSDDQNINLANKEKFQHNYFPNNWDNLDRISSVISRKMANDSGSFSQVEILKEDVKKLLQKSRNHVQWDGQKFVPRPIQLSSINLDKFRDSQSFQDRNVRVRYMHAELSTPIKLMEHAELTVVNEWNNLKDELKGLQQFL
jgi:hypothetical protein